MTELWWDLLIILAVIVYVIWRVHIERGADELDRQRERNRRNLGRNV